MKSGTKRLIILMMIVLAPMVSAEPISQVQDALPALPLRLIRVFPEYQNQNPIPTAPVFYGIASWYSERDPGINRHTANGGVFDDSKMTCASWDFPFGTRLQVTNLKNGKSVVCLVNDRGPAKRLGRLIDLTLGAFRSIADPKQGLARVSVTES